MIRKIKNIISISLVFILLTPMSVKFFDGFFHHHDHFICTAKHEHHFHEHHKKCPIPGFEFSLYSLNKIILETQKTFYCVGVNINNTSKYCNSKSKYSFLLRAPPVFANSISNNLLGCKWTYL